MEFLNAGKDFLTEAFIPRFQLDSTMAGENFEINTSIQLEKLILKSNKNKFSYILLSVK